jgi:hypothetical protein
MLIKDVPWLLIVTFVSMYSNIGYLGLFAMWIGLAVVLGPIMEEEL